MSIQESAAGWHFDNSYIRLPETFYARALPTPVCEPRMVIFNMPLAEQLGLNASLLAQQPELFAGNQLPEGSAPIAQAYAGHQFGYLTMLGDGRAILLGEQLTPGGQRWDIQLKGPGQTPYSRRGDGRAALGPMLREYIISEAMFALGIPTTRSLAVVSAGEPVYRESELPGAILTRVAASHIRVGTFQYAAGLGETGSLKALADYTIQRHYSELAASAHPYPAFLSAVIERQASLIAKWQLAGFIHGVMNTDNMAISGETIDYGPCAFMDIYDPATVFSSIDRQGRYAYGNQPIIAHWNLARFTETLLPLIHDNTDDALAIAQAELANFPVCYHQYWLSGMRKKLGLLTEGPDDISLIDDLLNFMLQNQLDYTHTFRALSFSNLPDETLFQETDFISWYHRWQARLQQQPESLDVVYQTMRCHNPAVIPRNSWVEDALRAAVEQHDLSMLKPLLSVLEKPYTELEGYEKYYLCPEPTNQTYQTFCGT